MKRLIDIIVSIIALLVLMPVFIPIMILLRFSAEGEVFYGQERIGFKNRKFKIWKFATMLKNSPNMGTGSLTVRNDPRVTTIGRFLRRSKLNELPQLINLLTGDMTLVGPRPQMKVDFEAYPAEVQAHIYDARPGITGIGSIVFRDEEKLLSVPGRDPRKFYEEHIAPYKGQLEMWYQSHVSLLTDLKILYLTALVILNPDPAWPFRYFRDLPELPDSLKSQSLNTSQDV